MSICRTSDTDEHADLRRDPFFSKKIRYLCYSSELASNCNNTTTVLVGMTVINDGSPVPSDFTALVNTHDSSLSGIPFEISRKYNCDQVSLDYMLSSLNTKSADDLDREERSPPLTTTTTAAAMSRSIDPNGMDRFLEMAGVSQAQLDALVASDDNPSESDAHVTRFTDRSTAGGGQSTRMPVGDSTSTAAIDPLRSLVSSPPGVTSQQHSESQFKQAQLVQRLQSKILQYKKRNSDLELEVEQLKAELETADKVLQSTTESLNVRLEAGEARARTMEAERAVEFESTLMKLGEEQQKSADLAQANEVLRNQLDQALQANQGLSQDVARLTLAWRNSAHQLDQRESEWRDEEAAFNDYFAAEHSRLLVLWRAVIGLRRQFTDLRQHTDRDLSQAKNDLARHMRSIDSCCGNLEVNLRADQTKKQADLARDSKAASQLEAEASDRIRSLTDLLAKSQCRLGETEAKLNESQTANERLMNQLADRDRILATMRQLRSGIYGSIEADIGGPPAPIYCKSRKGQLTYGSDGSLDYATSSEEGSGVEDADDHLKATRRLIECTHGMHQALSQIAQLVISDARLADTDEVEEPNLKLSSSTDWPCQEEQDQEDLTPTPTEVPVGDGVESDKTLVRRGRRGHSKDQLSKLGCLAKAAYKPGSSLHLAESTVAALQTELNRRAGHVHRLRFRTQSFRDQLVALTRRSEESESERRRMTEQVGRLRGELESLGLDMDKMARERDRLQHGLTLASEERKLGDQTRSRLAEQMQELQIELDHDRAMVRDASQQRDEALSDREAVKVELERQIKELASTRLALETAEEKVFNFREELTTIREVLKRTELEKEVLGHEKTDAVGTAERVQNKIDSLEQDLNQSRIREGQLRDKLNQLESTIEIGQRDQRQLTQQLTVSQTTELRLTEERSSLRAERQQLRDQLEQLYVERGSLKAELDQAKDGLARNESIRVRQEAELSELGQDRLALMEAMAGLERQKASYADDLANWQRDSERHSTNMSRLIDEKEALCQVKAELTLKVSVLERDIHQLTEHIASLKSEKEALESTLFDSQQFNERAQSKQLQCERELGELRSRRESLQSKERGATTLSDELSRLHANYQIEIEKAQRGQHELSSRLTGELEDLRSALSAAERRTREAEDACMQAVMRADRAVAAAANNTTSGRRQQALLLTAPVSNVGPGGSGEEVIEGLGTATLGAIETVGGDGGEVQKLSEDISRLTRELLAAQRERDEARLLAEQERQHALLFSSEEKVGLQEKIKLLQSNLVNLQSNLDRGQHEHTLRSEQDRISLRKANDELRELRNQLQETGLQHEREVRELKLRIQSLEGQRDQLAKDSSQLQLQARLAQEAKDSFRVELSDYTSRIRTSEEVCDTTRRTCAELKQRISELERDKAALDVSNNELRHQLKVVEMDRVELGRQANVVRSQLQGTELDRSSAERRVADLQDSLQQLGRQLAESRRETSEMRGEVKRLESGRQSLEQELNDLKQANADQEAREESLRRDRALVKQRLTETDAAKLSLQSEVDLLSHQLIELEERMRSKERTSTATIDSWQRDYRRLEENKKILEAKLESLESMVIDLRSLLTESQVRIQTLESELSLAMSTRQEAETRLAAIHSILRRLLGFRQSQYSCAFNNNNNLNRSLEAAIDGEKGQSTNAVGDPTSDPREWRLGRSRFDCEEDHRRHDVTNFDDHRLQLGSAPRNRASISSRRSKSVSPVRAKPSFGHATFGHNRSLSNERTSSIDLHRDIEDVGGQHERTGPWLDAGVRPMGRYFGLPGSDLDPEAVRSVIKDFLRQLVNVERARDQFEARMRRSDEHGDALKRELCAYEQEIVKLKASVSDTEQGKSTVLEQLSDVRSAITEHESALAKSHRECDNLQLQLASCEQQLNRTESDKLQLQARLEKVRASEQRLEIERRDLLHSLDAAETKFTQTEVSRRRLDGELGRAKTSCVELEQENQSLTSRLESSNRANSEQESKLIRLQVELDELKSSQSDASTSAKEMRDQLNRSKQEQGNLERSIEELRSYVEELQRREVTGEQERRVLQERIDLGRTNLADTKSKLQEALNQLQQLRSEQAEGQIKQTELELQLRQTSTALGEAQAKADELQARLTTIQGENTGLIEAKSALTRELNDSDVGKHEAVCELNRLRKELSQVKKNNEKLERDLEREKQMAAKIDEEKASVALSARQLDDDNLALRRELQKMQVYLTKQEDTHVARLHEAKAKQRVATEVELDRQRSAREESEKSALAHDRAQRQRIRSLEEQLSSLKQQLGQDVGGQSSRRLLATNDQSFQSSSGLASSGMFGGGGGGASSSPLDLINVRAILDRNLPRGPFMSGLYKPTIAPSRFDPYYYQVTGSTPSHIDQSPCSSGGRRAVGDSSSPLCAGNGRGQRSNPHVANLTSYRSRPVEPRRPINDLAASSGGLNGQSSTARINPSSSPSDDAQGSPGSRSRSAIMRPTAMLSRSLSDEALKRSARRNA